MPNPVFSHSVKRIHPCVIRNITFESITQLVSKLSLEVNCHTTGLKYNTVGYDTSNFLEYLPYDSATNGIAGVTSNQDLRARRQGHEKQGDNCLYYNGYVELK